MTMATLFGRIIPRVLPHDHGAADGCAVLQRESRGARGHVGRYAPERVARARGMCASRGPPGTPLAAGAKRLTRKGRTVRRARGHEPATGPPQTEGNHGEPESRGLHPLCYQTTQISIDY